jgi:Mrp family chromosome partitioning ATPase
MDVVPENANEGCVGPKSDSAGKASSCAGCPNQAACATGKGAASDPAAAQVAERLANVKNKILVGKSTFSSQLAFSLALRGKQVGLLDVDICGPSIPRMLGLLGHEVHQSASGWSPVYVEDNLGVMSIGFMLPQQDDAVIWRGPRKNGLIKQFLTDVVWNDLDFLVIDTPPGTSDEHISIVQLLKESNITGAIVVTTPQEVSMADVRKELNFCKKTGIRVLGVVENMADFSVPLSAVQSGEARILDANGLDVTIAMLAKLQATCPEMLSCSLIAPLFTPSASAAAQSNPQTMCAAFGVPYLGRLPMDPNVMRACESGQNFLQTFPSSAAAAPLRAIVDQVVSVSEHP